MKIKLYLEPIFLIIIGILTSLSLPPFNYLIINFFTFSLFFLFLNKKLNQKNNFKLFFLYGWLFGFGYFGSNLYWISISLSFDQNFKSLIPLTTILIPSFLAIFYGLITLFFKILNQKNILSSFLVFSAIFGVFEFIRGNILTGFPWNLIAYSFTNHLEILSITSIIGTYGFNLFCISLFSSPSLLILGKTKKDIGIFISLLIFIMSFYIYGLFYKEKFFKLVKEDYDYKVRVVGSNIGLNRFYKENNHILAVKELIKISNPNPNEKIIFVWPEGIIPVISPDELSSFKLLFSENFNDNHLLIIGTSNQSVVNGSENYFNSLTIYDNEFTVLNSYDKINLVPFGEFLPLENIFTKIGLRSLTNNYQSFSSGTKRSIIEIKKQEFFLRILPLVCYEIIYSGNLFENSNFDLIVNISEDGWFGQSIGPEQHFVHSIFRAVESGKYLLRSANNGIAAVVNPLGDIEQIVDFGESGFVDFEGARKIQPTIFSKHGNKIFILLILLYIFLIFSFNKIKND